MRVLWFSNSPGAAYNDKIKGTGGWLAALDRMIQDRVELHVAYTYPYMQKPFQNGKTWYHPIYTGNIVKENIIQRIFPNIHKDLTKKYLQVVHEVQPDIIHIHGSENSFHNIAGKTTVPVVLSIQGNPTVCAIKYDAGFHGKYRHTCMGKMTLKSMVFGRRTYQDSLNILKWFGQIEQMNFSNIKNVIGRTDWDRRITRVLAPESRYFVGNEALRESFYKSEWKMGVPENKLIIHTTNSNAYYKGFETLCHALTLLNRIGCNVEWRVAGVTENSEINLITKKYLGRDYPQKGLMLMGALDEQGLVESLLSSHLYVMPSHIENSPNSLCEAMILGMPCITTLAGGSDSMLINKKEGLVIQDGDPWSMAGAILELKNSWLQAVAYGQEARRHALIRHDRATIVNNLMATYQTIIDESK